MNVSKRKRAKIKESITVFPARAGVIHSDIMDYQAKLSLSRTSGSDPADGEYIEKYTLSFPHERE